MKMNKNHGGSMIPAQLVGNKIISYCSENEIREPIASIEVTQSKLSNVILTDLEAYLQSKGNQWENVTVIYKDVPERVECNSCGTRFSAHAVWSPCTDCGNPGAFYQFAAFHIKLKEIRTESGMVHKAKRSALLL
jgi:ribosomal protein S27E